MLLEESSMGWGTAWHGLKGMGHKMAWDGMGWEGMWWAGLTGMGRHAVGLAEGSCTACGTSHITYQPWAGRMVASGWAG
jgi:hypothetical protein